MSRNLGWENGVVAAMPADASPIPAPVDALRLPIGGGWSRRAWPAVERAERATQAQNPPPRPRRRGRIRYAIDYVTGKAGRD